MNTATNDLVFRPFYLVERLTGELGVSVSYAYEDLVFLEHSDVLLQFDQVEQDTLRFYINSYLESSAVEIVRDRWLQAALMHQVKLVFCGSFSVEQTFGKEEINITFN